MGSRFDLGRLRRDKPRRPLQNTAGFTPADCYVRPSYAASNNRAQEKVVVLVESFCGINRLYDSDIPDHPDSDSRAHRRVDKSPIFECSGAACRSPHDSEAVAAASNRIRARISTPAVDGFLDTHNPILAENVIGCRVSIDRKYRPDISHRKFDRAVESLASWASRRPPATVSARGSLALISQERTRCQRLEWNCLSHSH